MRYTIPVKLRRLVTVTPAPHDRREHVPLLPEGDDPDLPFDVYDDMAPYEPCWLVDDKHLNNAGYGQIKFNGKTWNTHRLAWHILVEKLPLPGSARAEDGDILDHLCERRACCNPAHLDKISQSDNVKRGARWRS